MDNDFSKQKQLLERTKYYYELSYKILKQSNIIGLVRAKVVYDLSLFYYQKQLDLNQAMSLCEEEIQYFNDAQKNDESDLESWEIMEKVKQNLTVWKLQSAPVTLEN